MEGRKIVRLRIRDYRGIEELDMAVAPAGMVIKGPNGAGKTSVLNAIRAALAARDIGQDAIRIGADRAEILVDLDCASAKRVITEKTSSLDVRSPEGKAIPAPQKWLKELLGTAALDPVEFFAGKPEERRKALLAALPADFDSPAAEKAIPTDLGNEFASVLSPLMSAGGHALAISAAIAKVFFDARTDTNRQLKAAENEQEAAIAEGPIPARTEPPGNFQARETEARAALAELEGRAKRAAAHAEARERSAAKIVELRKRAKEVLDPTPPDGSHLMPGEEPAPTLEDLESARADVLGKTESCRIAQEALDDVGARLENLRKAFEKAAQDKRAADEYLARSQNARRDAEALVERTIAAIAQRDRDAERNAREARDWLGQADELQKTLELTEAAPTATELEAAKERVAVAEKRAAEETRHYARRVAFEGAAERAKELRKRAERLSKLVDHFREVYPKAVIASGSAAIAGLAIEGDRILLDGVDVDACSGREQLRFAVEIARRANAKSRILVCDGLERLDPEQYAAFVREATRDDYQLIATRVDRGEVVFESISFEEGGS